MKTELILKKVKCIKEFLGFDILIPANEKSYDELKSLPYATFAGCKINYKGKHSLKRHNLFFSCVKLVADNLGKEKREIEELCKIDCRFFEGFTYYKDKHGNERCNINTKHISFDMSLKEADEFYNKAFDMLASYLNITTDELINEAKLKMREKHYCIGCGKPASQSHHCFSQSKPNIEKYGKKLIDRQFNRRWYCADCHTSHAHVLPDHLWDEQRFIKEAQKEGYL